MCTFDIIVLPGEEDRVLASNLEYQSNNLMLQCVTRAGGPQAGSIYDLGKLHPLAQPHLQSHGVHHVDTRTTLTSVNI